MELAGRFLAQSNAMKKIIFTRSVMVPSVGIFNNGQQFSCDDSYAGFLVKKGYAKFEKTGISRERKKATSSGADE